MAYRPSWQGHLKLSLVTCPVALYTATNSAGDIHFHLINPKTHNRIRMITTDPDSGPIERSQLVKGFEVSKGEYILLTDEEIKSVRLESTRTIDIAERKLIDAMIDAGPSRFGFGEADAGQFGVGERAPWHDR